MVSRGTEGRPRNEAGPADGSSVLVQFFPPSLFSVSSTESPAGCRRLALQPAICVSPLGASYGTTNPAPLRKEGPYVKRLALLHRLAWVILISPLLSHCPHEWSNVPKTATSWQPNYISWKQHKSLSEMSHNFCFRKYGPCTHR